MIRRRATGFTLVEVMVALFVFAILAAASYSTLAATVETVRTVSDQMVRLQALQRALQTLQLDFSQIHPRPIREELASGLSPALVASGQTEYLVELTRGGWSNPLVLPRPGLQRVSYYLDEDQLIRQQWPVLDRTLGTEATEFILLDGVEDISIQYLPFRGDWSESWPPIGSSGGAGLRSRPRAVQITVTLSDYGEVRRLIEVTG